MIIFIWGPDFLSIILNGMPLSEGSINFAGNGWYYVGRDLDFFIEGNSFFPIDSIWRLAPLRVVLPATQDLIFVGIFQLFCFLLLTKYFYVNHSFFNNSSKTIDYSLGKSLRLCAFFVIGFGLILLSSEIIYNVIFQKDLILECFVSLDINQQKLVLHPIYFTIFSLVGCLGAAIFEETFFRRILFPLLRIKLPFVLAAILNALLFAGMHEFNKEVILQTFICGFVCCIIYENSKSIAGCILFHFLGNLFLLIIPTFYPMDLFRQVAVN